MIKISDYYKNLLVKLDEYGMGFQIGSIITTNGIKIRGVILNATVLCPMDEYEQVSELTYKYEYAIRSSTIISIKEIYLEKRSLTKIKKISRMKVFSEGRYVERIYDSAVPARDAEISYTFSGDIYKRFSAYENDFRVTADKGLTPGTFGTTEEDAKNIKTGMDAIARYALENKMSANKVFTIKPPQNTKLKQGIVEPAYGEPGGGVEVIFVDGSPNNTVTGPIIIAEK